MGDLAALGHTIDPLTLFTAYAVANVLGLLLAGHADECGPSDVVASFSLQVRASTG